jgi:hypothetical protein
VDRGELRQDIDLEAASRAVNVLLVALGDSQLAPNLNTYFQVSDRDVSFERTVDAALDMILQGLGTATRP